MEKNKSAYLVIVCKLGLRVEIWSGDLVSVFVGNLGLLQKLLDSHSKGLNLHQMLSGTDVKIHCLELYKTY